MSIKNLFSEKQKVMSQKSISDITGSATPVESSDYIDNYLAKKERFLPPVNFATASNFAKFGSAKEYSADAIQRIYNTYPYDGSLSEKISWLNSSNFYDLYIFNHEYPRTCGYAVFSPLEWGSRVGAEVSNFGYPDSVEYIQVKGGPHPDPSSGSLKLSRQFPAPYDGKANLYDATTGINRESNLALDVNSGVTIEFWFKYSATAPEQVELASKTSRQVIFDLWNGQSGTGASDSYGRMLAYTDASGMYARWHSGSYYSAFQLSSETTAAVADGNWHHLAITAKVVPYGSVGQVTIEWNDFLDGQWSSKGTSLSIYGGGGFFTPPMSLGSVTGSMIANLGAARIPGIAPSEVTTAVAAEHSDGFGKISGSLDEFRYWKTARTPQEIKRFWNTQIGGGSNTDGSKFSGSAQPVDLGVYYKFNEGNVGNAIVDSSVLDYSGRISNGIWTGYIAGSSRVAGETSSAIIESSASTTEFKDPIIYSSHPDVSSLYTVLTERGEEWDLQNNMALYHTMPEWITSEDQDEGGEQLKKLTQIIASYLDTTFLQIQALPSITKNQYPYEELTLHNPNEWTEHQTDVLKYSNSPVPFARNLIEDLGMGAPEIFAMADELAILGNRDDIEEFDQKLYDIKNTIYQNIHNNLSYIYKSKGTEKSFRNLIRCYGVDDELIKINLYIDGATYSFSDSDYRSTSVKDKYIDFNDADRNRSTIYQSASFSTSNSISYIPGMNPTLADTAGATGSAMTFEADVIFPHKFERTHPSNLWYSYPDLTSSIFGCHTAQPTVSTPENFAWATRDSASFQVHALRDIEDSKDVRFMLTSSNGSIPTLTSDLFQEVYENERWLFAVKVYPESPLEGKWVSGGSSTVSGSWIMEFQGYNPLLDQMQNSFSVSASIPARDGTYFMNANKRVYAGAHRENFSGSLDIKTDIKVGSVRVWDDYLTDFDLSTHAKDPTNYGRTHAYKNSYLFSQDTTPGTDIDAIPQFETLLLNWTFEDVTGSTNGAYLQDHYGGSAWEGSFEVLDYSSGSDDRWEVPSRYKYHYTGRGDWFLPEDTTNLVDSNYLSVVKTNLPEVSSGEDMISILDTDDNYFTRDSKPINHYFAIEKSMYQTISEEMLKIFATAVEFNNLVGEPVNRYRQEYKSLGKLREAFFRKVGNTPDFNRFVNFYKWIDGSLTDMLMQLVPMSANFSTGVKTMVESHILERNKYWNKFPTLEMKAKPIVGRLKGINELSYDWEHGHPSYTAYPYATSKSIEFVSGSSHYIDFGDQDHWTFGDESDDSPFSISCWIKFDDLDTANMPSFIMGKNSEYRIAWGSSPATGGGQGLYFVVRDFTGTFWLSKCITKAAFKTLVTEDSWHHLTFVYDGTADSSSDISIYIDGVLWGGLNPAGSTDGVQNVQGASHGSYVAMHNTTNEFQVGRLGGYAGDYFDGHIDELAMFNEALTAAQASLLYNNGYPVDIAAEGIGTLAAYWKLGDGDDTGASGIKDSSGNNRHGTVSGISSFSSDVFWAGPKPPTLIENKNCLWWKDRSEASASFTAGNQTDTDRNVLRRILTSDVTTNKILATGEYTDPTNYPNSGFPNAAEFNLAQDGANLAARTQYKGSTYALRSFSKPYKLESEETIQIHGGINYHANKRRELTKHWAVLASPMGAYISLAPGYTDDLLDCDDVINPSKKEFHSFAIDPGGGFGSGPVPEKGAHFAPFNFVSSSVTTNSSLAETGIDIVNLHDDSYGDTNERPMQGPFTERHVGGMAHRHQDISDTTHTSVTRTENFKVSGFKDVGFFVIPGDYASPGTKHSDQPFNRFYRDGVAKRPVNIRNILTTTDSALSQSALGNYENEIQILNTQNDGGTFLAKMQAATGSDGFYTINYPSASLVISDISDTPKLLAVGKALLDSSTALLPPYTTSQFNPYLSKNKITERFSAPGDPSTAGDAFGGFGIDKAANKYSVYNALPWRNRQVRFPTNALLTAHTGKYGSFSGSALGATDVTTAATASFHKTHRNTDYRTKHTGATTAYRSNSVYFGGSTADQFYRDNTNVDDLNKMTVSIWFYLPSGGSATAQLISFNSNDGIATVSDSYIRFRVKQASSWTWFNTPVDSIQNDRWHHVVFALDQGETQEWRTTSLDYATMSPTNKYFPKFWIDGEQVSVSVAQDTDWSGAYQTDFGDICVGTYYKGNTTSPFAGYIQDISLWNDILTDAQVKDIFRLPGYDSSGPGDLTRLSYVSADEDTNKLHAWWQFNHATDIDDVAPIGNSLHLDSHNGSPSVNTDNFLAANDIGTYCGQRFDNYYIQHPIPANDFGYAWITASADHTEGCELLTTASFVTASAFGSYTWQATGKRYWGHDAYHHNSDIKEFLPLDFAGLNTNIYEPVSSSNNILGYPSLTSANISLTYDVIQSNYPNQAFIRGDGYSLEHGDESETTTGFPGIAAILNGINLHRNGPYGYPSWKQIRGGNHPIIREHKKSNIHSMLLTTGVHQKPGVLTAQPTTGELGAKHRELIRISNLVESPVSINYPLVHRVETVMDGIAQELTVRHTYANNLVTFANPILRRMVDRLSPKEQPRQTYDDFKDTYLSGDEDPSANPVIGFKSLIYKQVVYPKLENTYLSGSRARLAYAETAAHISQSKNGEYRTFWKDNLDDRNRGEGALNSMGYPIYSDINQATGWESSFISNYVLGSGTLSTWPLDVGLGTQDHLVGYSAALYGFFVGSSSLGNSVTLIPPSSDEFGGTWGELNRDPNATLFGSLTTAQLNTLNGLAGTNGYTHFMNDDNIICHATASQCIDFYDLSGISWQDPGAAHAPGAGGPVLGGYPLVATTSETSWLKKTPCTRMGSGVWSTAHWAGRSPWYDSYEDYSDDIRPMAKDHTILPEFKISDHIDYYLEQGGFKDKRNRAFLNLPGASITSSATGGPDEPLYEVSPYNENFFKEYSHSDFMKDFEVIQEEHDSLANASIISLKCSAVKKLLPYDGFYPVQRCLQLGGIMSASYAPYLSGSASSSYGPDIVGNDPNYKYRAERLQSFLQPFYAPGIMYNSIKSGIAVDYPIHTSPAELTHISTWENGWVEEVPSASLGAVIGASSSHHVITSDPDWRVPFEALIDPNAHIATSYNPETNFMDRAKMYLTAPYYGSSSFYAQWLGNSKPHYRFAINNFAAEVPNFFLKNKNLSSFRSKPQSQFTEFTSGTAYYMDVVLQKTPDFIMNSHYNPNWRSFAPAPQTYFSAEILTNPHFNPDGIISPPGGPSTDDQLDWGSLTGWGYGPKYHVTGTITSDASIGASGSLLYSDTDEKYVSTFFNAIDPSFAVHAPPYLYGRAVSRMIFKPHEVLEMAPGESARFSLDTIIASLEGNIEEQLEHGVGQARMTALASRALKKVSGDPNNFAAKDNVMSISASINLFGTTNIPQIEYDAITRQPLTAKATGAESEKTWVIHTKWETPALNFANGTGGTHSGVVEGTMVMEDESDIRNVTGSWWEDITIPSSLKRPLGMWKGYGSVPSAESGIKLSLKESFPARNANGTDTDGNKISSLIGACGFQSTDMKIGELAEYKMISEAVIAIPFVDIEGRRKFFALGNTIAESRGVFNKALSSKEGPGSSVISMAKKMPNYIFPPHLDFLNDEAIEPFAMYIFEFTHKLSQQDLSNIWQNVMPDIAVTAEKAHASVTHKTGENEFFRGNKIPDNTRWMVFKTKRRSASNYFKMTADAKDDNKFNFLSYVSDQEMERYNYNWPYDFFSLVELAKIDTKIGIGDDAFPMPPVLPRILGSMTMANTTIQGVPSLVANPTTINANNLGSSLPAVTYHFDTGLQAAQTAATQTAMESPLINAPLLNAIRNLGPTGGNN